MELPWSEEEMLRMSHPMFDEFMREEDEDDV